MAQGNKEKFKFYPLQAFSDDSLVPSVILHDSETTLCLDRSVHAKKSSMNAFQVIEDFLVESCQFFIETDCPVFIRFLALDQRMDNCCNLHTDRFLPAGHTDFL